MSKNIPAEPKIVALKDLRLNAQSYINKVSKGQSFIVVKRSKPAFRMEPIEEQWETVVDFRDMPGGGIWADDLLKRLKRLDGQDR